MNAALELFRIHNKPMLIAGPCGAESMQQLQELIVPLKTMPAFKLLRAGVWKPRTRPNGFQGHGEIALTWLKELKDQYKVPIAVEVASPMHVEQALKYNMDVLWIGARTTVNPFYVQDIVNALSGIDIPVMIKNPVHADVKLWIGALERFLNSGKTNLAAIHRGFYSYASSGYRNSPLWSVALEFKTYFPDIPMYADTSHMAGKRQWIAELSQQAFNLGYQGLMLETHPQPECALSDADQQLTPNDVIAMWNQLEFRTAVSTASDHLQTLRKCIDERDKLIIEQLAHRLKFVDEIADLKKDLGLTIFQLERWKELLHTRSVWAAELGLRQEFIEKLCQLIHDESIQLQQQRWNSNNTTNSF